MKKKNYPAKFPALKNRYLKIVLSCLLVLNGLSINSANAQCTNSSSFATAAINPSGAQVTISTCSFAGEYSTITGAVAGQTLNFTSSVAGDEVTIHSGTYNGPVLANGPMPFSFSNTFTGTIYAHWNTPGCGSQSSCRTTTVQCTSCTPPTGPCTFSSSFGSATINSSGAPVTISTCSFAGEYSTISGAVAGQILRFTSDATDYITIRSGTPSGPVVAYGQTPLVFNNTFTGTLYAHWALDAACGTQSSCRTTTVQLIASDLCANAIPITCGSTITGNTSTNATIDAVPACVINLSTAPGVWYSFVGTGQNITMSLCGSSYDTKLGVFTGSCTSLVCVTGDDDFCGLQSQVTFTSVNGTNYYILVSGFAAGSGAFTLATSCVTSCIPPTITCPSNVSINNDVGQCGAIVNYDAATATGTTPVIVYSIPSGSVFPIGTTTVTATATNDCGADSCTFTVTVLDTIAPVFNTCSGGNFTITVSGTSFMDEVGWTLNDANNVTVVSGGPYGAGSTNTVTYTGNNGPYSFFIETQGIFNDNNASYIINCSGNVVASGSIGGGSSTSSNNICCSFGCLPNITVNNDPNTCGARVCYPTPTIAELCPPSPPAGYTFLASYDNSYYYQATSLSDYATAQANASAAGGHLAVITSAEEDSVIGNNGGGYAWMGGNDLVSEGTYQWVTCEPFSYVAWCGGEPNGGTSENYLEYEGLNCFNDLNEAQLRYSILEIESAKLFQISGLPQNSVFPVGTTTNTFVAVDAAGNSDTCSFTVTVLDTISPQIACNADTTVYADQGNCGAVVNYTIVATDNCSSGAAGNITFSEAFISGQPSTHCDAWNSFRAALLPSYIYTKVTIKGSYDPVGVSVTDPVIVSQLADALRTGTAIQLNDGIRDWSVGNCGYVDAYGSIPAIEFNAEGSTCDCLDPAYVVRPCVDVYSFNPNWGGAGTATCSGPSQTLTVIFETLLPGIMTSQIEGLPSGSIFPVGTTTNTFVAIDSSGNSDTCSFTVTVLDTIPPTITCAANVVSCDSNVVLTPPTVSDNCGISGNALDFDGVDDFVQMSDFNLGTSDFTVETWIKPNAITGAYLITNRSYECCADGSWWNLILAANGHIGFEMATSNSTYSYTEGTKLIPVNQWSHVAVTRSGLLISTYVNGELDTTYIDAVARDLTSGNGIARLGGWPDYGAAYYNGSLDEVRVWNVARTQSEIQLNMINELSAQSGITALYHLNQGKAGGSNSSETTAADASGNGNTGTLSNFALSGATSNWVCGVFGCLTNDAPSPFPVGTTTVIWTATDASGNSSTCTQTVTINPSPTPHISCNATFCAGKSAVLDAGAGYSHYLWSTNATSRKITVNTANTFTVTVTNSYGCTGTDSVTTIVIPLPNVSFIGLLSLYNVNAGPVTLTGSPSGGVFSGPGISGNKFYPNVAGIGGPYVITYTYTNSHGCSKSVTHQTSVTGNCVIPAKPGSISGTVKVCPGETKTYTISSVANATSYAWTAPTGCSVVSGQGGTAVSIQYGTTFSGNISVAAVCGCGSSAANTLLVSKNAAPALPSVISGKASGACNQASLPYSVTNVAGNNYTWAFTNVNASILSGQGTNAVTAKFNAPYTSGSITVKATNGCGTSATRSLAITAAPAKPGAITGSANACANQLNVPYSIAPVTSAVNYTWAGPLGSHIKAGLTTSSANSLTTTYTSVNLNFGATVGAVKVRANNSCGSSAYASKTVTVNCREVGSVFSNDFDVVCYPVPAKAELNVVFNAEEEVANTIIITDVLGKTLMQQIGHSIIGENKYLLDVSTMSSGIYMIEVINGEQKSIQQIMIE